MLGFTGVDSAESVIRERGYMADAQARSPFLAAPDGIHLAVGKGPDSAHETLFFNELGVSSIQIGVAAFHCMGVMPPHDHPHVYLNMGERTDLLCPYCSTEYVLNPALRWNQTNPANCCAVSPSAA